MFKIYDGREHFYQWDLERKLLIEDASINQVHFCNRTDDCSLVVEVREEGGARVADVPNVLLQDSFRIKVYGFDTNYTKHSAQFEVIARTKPDGYVYTETEVLNYQTIMERLDGIESDIGEAINDYLEEHPIEVPEVDLSGYATTEYVDKAVESVDIPKVPTKVSELTNDSGYITESALPNLDGYALKSEIPTVPDVSNFVTMAQVEAKDYATKDEVAEAVGAIDVPEVSLDGYATEQYVQEYVAANGGGGSAVGADEVYIGATEPTDASVEIWINPDGTGAVYATEEYVTEAIEAIEIPDVSGFTTMSAVEAKGYQTEAQVNALINTALGVIENGTY